MTTEEFIQGLKAVKEAFESKQKSEQMSPKGSESGRSHEVKERKVPSRNNDVMEIIKTKVTYDDVMRWIKENIQPSYNGIYLHRSKARFFDKGDFSLKIFFSIDKEPQTGDNDPAIVFTYEKLDDILTDMLSDKDTLLVQLNNKK